MKRYYWNEYNFTGTKPELAKHFGVSKCMTYVNAVKRMPRHVYNCMDAKEQAEYEKKRERAKPAYRLYLDEEQARYIDLNKTEYEAISLPIVQEDIGGPFKLIYKNRILPENLTGDRRDELSVASAMKKYQTEAIRFAEQVMLATGYFNSRMPSEKPHSEINYTSLTLSYSNGIKFTFVSERSCGGIDNCYLQLITLDGRQIYNGCFRKYSSVTAILQVAEGNPECMNADWYLPY